MASPETFRWALIVLLLVAAAAVLFARAPISQDSAYHQFADQRTLLGVPHFANVVSNLPFLAVGAAGVWLVLRRQLQWRTGERSAYFCFFLGVGLTAFGSAYYHLDPTNARLFWDRMPMAVAFMGLFSALLSERATPALGTWALPLLLAAGVASTVYWRWTDDLRPYYLVQFYPMAAVPLLLALFPSRFTGTSYLFLTLGCYLLAKVCEMRWDTALYEQTGVSGHTLKHLLAALATYWVLRMLQARRWQRALR